jgi:hypothetical protein
LVQEVQGSRGSGVQGSRFCAAGRSAVGRLLPVPRSLARSISPMICRFPRHGWRDELRGGARREAAESASQTIARPRSAAQARADGAGIRVRVRYGVWHGARSSGRTGRLRFLARFVHPAEFGRPRQTDDAPRNRPNRKLSPQAQSALDRLNALGADVHADFTPHELRHAFRALARRYHPDRYPASSATEKARLSRQFIQLHDAYRELKGAIPVAA